MHVNEDCWRSGASVAFTVICATRMEQEKHMIDRVRNSTIVLTCRASPEAPVSKRERRHFHPPLKKKSNRLWQMGRFFHLMPSLLCRLLLVRVVDCTVNLSDCYSYRLIGKLTAFLQLQEFSQRNLVQDLYLGLELPRQDT